MSDAVSSRLHYLDTMRGVLMLLGVVLHSARPYDSEPWRVNDPGKIPALDVVVETLALFRMPSFFVVAGFFAMYLIVRRPTAVFLRERMQRVVVPLVVMLVSVNVLQLWFVARHEAGGTENFISGILLPALMDGELASHLWFLACLAIYFALTALAAPSLRMLAARQESERGDRSGLLLPLALAAAVVFPLVVAVIGKLTAPLLNQWVLGLVRVSTVLDYLPFFAVGVMLCAFPRLLERFARVDVGVIGLALCAAVGLYLGAGREDTAWRALSIVSGSLLGWMAVRAVFSLFRRFAGRPSPTFRYLSDASYSVYLFHHVVVIMVATWLLQVDVSPWLKYLVVMIAASLVSLAVYHFVIRRSRVMRYLFNGAVRPRGGMPATRDQPSATRGDGAPVVGARPTGQ